MFLRHYKHLIKEFYAGPAFSGMRPWRTKKYQSPTLTAALWLYALSMRHFTTSGSMIFLCCSLITLYALFTLAMPIHILAFALLTLLCLNIVTGFVFRPRVRLRRRLPERLSAGVETTVSYHVTHQGRFPLWNLVLDPMPLPRFLGFPAGRASVDTLLPGEHLILDTRIKARRRGRYTLAEPMIGTAFPFHMWRWTASGEGKRSILVHPPFTPLRRLDLDAGLRYQAGGIALSSEIGNTMEFLGTREFRPGDDPRRIHWRSWARTSYPVVKEFREEYLCRTALIVDTRRPRPPFWQPLLRLEDRPFEAALSMAAAMADALSQSEYIIDLFAAGPEVYRFQGGRSLGFLGNILDILACLEPHHDEPFAEFTGELLEEVARISSALFVLLTWNDVRRDLILRLQSAGVVVKGVYVTRETDPPDDLPATITMLRPEDILAGRCRTL